MNKPLAPPPWRRGLRNGVMLALLVLAAWLLVHEGELAAFQQVLTTLPLALLASVFAHLPQLFFTGEAWRVLLPPGHRPSLGRMLLLRWYREGADSLLPAGAVVGQAGITRLMIRDGMPVDLAAGTATLGISLEAISQALFTMLGLAMFLLIRSDAEVSGFLVGAAVAAAIAGVMIALQRPPALNLLRRVLLRLSRRWPSLEPLWLDRFQMAMLRLHGQHRALAAALLLHLCSWVMGAVEMAVVLWLIGAPVSFAEALVIESFAQVLRNAGFLLPGSAGVEEGALIAGGLLVGVPLQAAVTAALLRRTREVLVGGAGLIAWRQDEVRGARQP